MSLRLVGHAIPRLPIDGAGIRPDRWLALTAREVARQPLLIGNAWGEIGEVFHCEGDPADGRVELEGDLSGFGGLAGEMAAGELIVRGNVGSRLGVGMTGGTIRVHGSVAHWAGAEMRGGLLAIEGDAGRMLGAALPGSRLGLRGGAILLQGDAQSDAGLLMRRGLIAIGGSGGAFLGRSMIAGTIVANRASGPGLGAGMKRGSIVLAEGPDKPILPTFTRAGRFQLTFLGLLRRHLRDTGIGDWFPFSRSDDHAATTPSADMLRGDSVVKGQGEILLDVH